MGRKESNQTNKHSYFVCVNSNDSEETAQKVMVIWALVSCQCDKYQNLMGWLV